MGELAALNAEALLDLPVAVQLQWIIVRSVPLLSVNGIAPAAIEHLSEITECVVGFSPLLTALRWWPSEMARYR